MLLNIAIPYIHIGKAHVYICCKFEEGIEYGKVTAPMTLIMSKIKLHFSLSSAKSKVYIVKLTSFTLKSFSISNIYICRMVALLYNLAHHHTKQISFDFLNSISAAF